MHWHLAFLLSAFGIFFQLFKDNPKEINSHVYGGSKSIKMVNSLKQEYQNFTNNPKKHHEFYNFSKKDNLKQWQQKLIDSFQNEEPSNYKNIKLPQYHRPPDHHLDNPENYDDLKSATDIQVLHFNYAKSHQNIKIRNTKDFWFEIPYEDPFPYVKEPQANQNQDSSDLEIILPSNKNISEFEGFKVIRKSTKEAIFDTSSLPFYFNEEYVELNAKIPSTDIFGLGERNYQFKLQPGEYTIYIVDEVGSIGKEKRGYNTHGHHPVYLMREQSGLFHMVFFRSGNPQSFHIRTNNTLTWRVIGGIVDIDFFTCGTDPDECAQLYHEYIGGWHIPPFWALGYHQGKWGYKNFDDLKQTVTEYNKAQIPFDTLWNDIDYQQLSQQERRETWHAINFSYDLDKYPPEKMKELYAKEKKKWIALFDPIICQQKENNPPYQEFQNVDEVMLKDPLRGGPLIIQAFCTDAYVIDFFNPKSRELWLQMLGRIDKILSIEGIFLDINEISNYCQARRWMRKYCDYDWDGQRRYYNLPFDVTGDNIYKQETLSLDAHHYGDYEELNVRPFVLVLQNKYTYEFLSKKFKFPFILSRASGPGSAKYSVHWVPDSGGTWQQMRVWMGGVLTLNLAGQTMMGIDVCGVWHIDGDEEEMCLRSHQMITLMPFVRNFSWRVTKFDGDIIQSMINTIMFRYSLQKYMYTIFMLLNKKGTYLRPAFFEFPQLKELYNEDLAETQIMLHKGLMCKLFIKKQVFEGTVLFPDSENWYHLTNLTEQKAKGKLTQIYNTPFQLLPIYVRGGYTIFRQAVPEGMKASVELNNTFMVYAGLTNFKDGIATSEGYIIDANTYGEEDIHERCIVQKACLLKVKISLKQKGGEQDKKWSIGVKGEIDGKNKEGEVQKNLSMSKLYLMGVKSNEKSFKLSKNNVNIVYHDDGNIVEMQFGEEVSLYDGMSHEWEA